MALWATSPRRRRLAAAFFVVLLIVVFVPCVGAIRDHFDDSIVAKDYRVTTWMPLEVKRDGSVCSQAVVPISPDVELVLPMGPPSPVPKPKGLLGLVRKSRYWTVRPGEQPGEVIVLVKTTQVNGGGSLRDLRERSRVWKREADGVLALDFDSGTGTPHGGTHAEAVFIVPADVKIKRASELQPPFKSRYDQAGYWQLPDGEAVAAGWEVIRHQPLAHHLFR